LKAKGVRVHYDDRSEKLGFKIREAQLQKTPYMLIIGDNEVQSRLVSVRLRTGETVNNLTIDTFVDAITADIRGRRLTSPLSQGKVSNDNVNQETSH